MKHLYPVLAIWAVTAAVIVWDAQPKHPVRVIAGKMSQAKIQAVNIIEVTVPVFETEEGSEK